MFKAIIFDLDDTLTQTRQTQYKTLKTTAKRFYNLEISDSDIDALYGTPYREFMQLLFRQCDDLDNIIKNFHVIRENNPNGVYPGTIASLKILQKKYRLGLLSAAGKHLVYKDVTDCGIGIDTFCHIQTEDDTTVHKPDPEVFQPTINYFAKFNIKPTQMLYVGDTLNDFLASSQAGLHFIGIPRLERERKKMQARELQMIDDIEQLTKLL